MKNNDTNVTYWKGVKRGFKGLVNFEGTTGRKEYFSFLSILMVLSITLFILTFQLIEVPAEKVYSIVEGFFWGFTALSLAATYRRFQDVQKPGILAFVIPAAFYFTIIISNNPFDLSQIVYYLCIGIITYCIVLLMQKSRKAED